MTKHKVRNADEARCAHCGGDIAVRNPTGNCDHLHYPENCKVCCKMVDEKKEKKHGR